MSLPYFNKVSHTAIKPWQDHLHINIVCSSDSTCLNHRSRIQVIWPHAIDNESCFLGERFQFFAVELHGKDRYIVHVNKTQFRYREIPIIAVVK